MNCSHNSTLASKLRLKQGHVGSCLSAYRKLSQQVTKSSTGCSHAPEQCSLLRNQLQQRLHGSCAVTVVCRSRPDGSTTCAQQRMASALLDVALTVLDVLIFCVVGSLHSPCTNHIHITASGKAQLIYMAAADVTFVCGVT